MELDECIAGCYACRDFLSKDIPLNKIWEILNSATQAQSAANLQSWYFIVVRDEEKKEQIAKASLNQKWMAKAPAYIVFCSDVDKCERLFPKRGRLYSTQNLAVAAQNAILKAHSMGWSSCWVGAFDEKIAQRILEIPDNIVPEIILVIGKPVVKRISKHARTELEKLTYFDKYGSTYVIPENENLTRSLEKTKKKVNDTMKDTMSKLKDFLKK